MENDIVLSFASLDIERGRKGIDDFFKMGTTFLSTRESRLFIRHLIDSLFTMYASFNVSSKEDTDAKKHEFIYLTNSANSFSQLAYIFTAQVTQILSAISNKLAQHYSKPVYDAISYINEHYIASISLEIVADQIGLTPAYLSHLFRKETGQSYSEYVNAQRISYAKNLLKEGKMNITAIANMLEYDDVRNFSKFFKRNVGISPHAYQKMLICGYEG